MRSVCLPLVVALLAASPAAAQDVEAPAEPDIEVVEQLDLELDRTERMTVPVRIEGRGPYSFIVDTGSERTVISRELAEELGLDPGRTATVHSMTEVSRIATVVIPELEVGRRTVSDIHAPALERRHLGAEGLLGIDSLQSQRVVLDFVRGEMIVTPSRREEGHPRRADQRRREAALRRRGLHPHALEEMRVADARVHHAVERHAAGHAQVRGSRSFL